MFAVGVGFDVAAEELFIGDQALFVTKQVLYLETRHHWWVFNRAVVLLVHRNVLLHKARFEVDHADFVLFAPR